MIFSNGLILIIHGLLPGAFSYEFTASFSCVMCTIVSGGIADSAEAEAWSFYSSAILLLKIL